MAFEKCQRCGKFTTLVRDGTCRKCLDNLPVESLKRGKAETRGKYVRVMTPEDALDGDKNVRGSAWCLWCKSPHVSGVMTICAACQKWYNRAIRESNAN